MEIAGNTVVSPRGVLVSSSSRAVVSNNRITSAVGVLGQNARDNLIERNAITTDPFGQPDPGDPPGSEPDVLFNDGLVLLPGAIDTQVLGNTLRYARSPSSSLGSLGVFHVDQLEGGVYVGPQRTLFEDNEISGYDVAMVMRNSDIEAVVHANEIRDNGQALALVSWTGTPDVSDFVFYGNDVVDNASGASAAQVVSTSPVELSWTDGAGRTVGNFWGHDCPNGPFFEAAGVDSNRADVVDSNAFGFRVASASLLSPDAIPVAPGCQAVRPDVPDVDTDGDGFTDREEVEGLTFFDDEFFTSRFLDLRALGANPLVPDVFVEIDHMPGPHMTPRVEAVREVVAAFARQGIALHVDLGSAGEGTELTLPGNDCEGSGDCTEIPYADVCGVDDRSLVTPDEPTGFTGCAFKMGVAPSRRAESVAILGRWADSG